MVQFNPWKGGGLIAVSYEARKCGVLRCLLFSSLAYCILDLPSSQVVEFDCTNVLLLFQNTLSDALKLQSRVNSLAPCAIMMVFYVIVSLS